METGPCQSLVLVRSLGASHSAYRSLQIWERFGLIKVRKEWLDLIVSFNESWFAYRELRNLLRVLNRLNPTMMQYVILGESYRQAVEDGSMDTYWRLLSGIVPDAEERLRKWQRKNGIERKPQRPQNIGHRGRRFSDEQIAEMRNMDQNGVLRKDIAETFGCSLSYVSAVLCGKVRTHANAAQQMTNECREAVLTAVHLLRASGQAIFSIADIVAECTRAGVRHSAAAIAQQITGQMCMNSINRSRKVRVFNDLVKVNRGLYRLFDPKTDSA